MQALIALGKACSTFAITNIDDLFILATFFAEAATVKTLTPFTITLGQYVGFTIVLAISMLGFAATVVLPTEPIGFLGLLPMMLGLWSLLDLFGQNSDEEDEEMEVGVGGWRAVSKVAVITVINGGDNIGTYIPLFAQARRMDMAVYLVTYYVLLGALCFVAWAVMQQKDILGIVEEYAQIIVPVAYMGIGLYILVDSRCYPWLVRQVNDETTLSGVTVVVVGTSVLLVGCTGLMTWYKLWRGGGKEYSVVAGEDEMDMNGRGT